MAQGSTVYAFDIELSDVDRGVYQTLELRVARHPSETPDYLAMRVLAYCLEYVEGIAFSKGLGDGDEPAVWAHDLTGVLKAWIEVGSPEPAKVHRASKAAPRVAVYAHKNPELVKRKLAGQEIHKGAEIPIYSFERSFLDELSKALDRRTKLDVSVNDRHVYVTVAGKSLEAVIQEQRIDEP